MGLRPAHARMKIQSLPLTRGRLVGVVFYFHNRTKLERGRTSRFEVEVQFVQQGTGKWAHYTGAILRFRRPEQRPRPFCWTLLLWRLASNLTRAAGSIND